MTIIGPETLLQHRGYLAILDQLAAETELAGPARDRAIRTSARITTSFPSKDWNRLDPATMAGVQMGRHPSKGRI